MNAFVLAECAKCRERSPQSGLVASGIPVTVNGPREFRRASFIDDGARRINRITVDGYRGMRKRSR